jgi:beta-lactamase class A
MERSSQFIGGRMRTYPFLMILLLLIARPVHGQTTEAKSSDLKETIDSLIEQSGAEVVGLAFYDLETSHQLLINERVSLHAASTMKVPVMMEIFRLVEAKKLTLREPVLIKNSFASIVDGSFYRLNKTDDSDEEL